MEIKLNNASKFLSVWIVGILLSVQAFAQGLTVKGVVKDNAGMGVIGANVLVKGTTVGTITDFDGNFMLEAKKGDVIVISFIGYKTQELPATATMNVTLQDDTEMLDDVVVIGYGSVKKNDAGSVTAIKPDELSKGITTNAQDMLTGKVAGVSVISNDGTPGGGAQIRIRGGSSLNASNDPLIVIDGLAIDNSGVKGMSNGLSMVNPEDIETFERCFGYSHLWFPCFQRCYHYYYEERKERSGSEGQLQRFSFRIHHSEEIRCAEWRRIPGIRPADFWR